MVRPGVEVVSRISPPNQSGASETGTAFFVGVADRGPTDRAVLVRNMSDFERWYGGRLTTSYLWDSLNAFFREGGSQARISRVVGAAAAADTVTLDDSGAADSLTVSSVGPGDTGLTVEVTAGTEAGTYRLVIAEDGAIVERSPNLVTVDDAVNWAATHSSYVIITAVGSNPPAVVAATPLAGGDADHDGITATEKATAIELHIGSYGAGQLLYPGETSVTTRVALLNHARATSRVALLDTANDPASATHTTDAEALRDDAGLEIDAEQYGALFAPWVRAPGQILGTSIIVPPSAIVAGLIAHNDGLTGNTNVPAAGDHGILRFGTALAQPSWSDSAREALNDGGVNVIREVVNDLRLYGYRTLAQESAWTSLASARTRMLLVRRAESIAEGFIFDQIDGRGRKTAEFGGALAGELQALWVAGALFGETADQAYVVDVGPTVNTPETIANQELRAVLGVRMSPFAELVHIEVVKVPVTETL